MPTTRCIPVLLYFWLLLVPGVPIYGQHVQFTSLTTRNGLPAMECYKVLQDKQGYIWVFTEYGITKHTGQRFVPVCTNIPVKDQNAYAVFQAENGEIYFANSAARVFKVKNDSAYSIKPIEQYTRNFNQPKDVIYQLIADKNGDIYFSSYENTFKYNQPLKKVEIVNPNHSPHAHIEFQKINQAFLTVRRLNDVVQQKITVRIKDSAEINVTIDADSLAFYLGSELLPYNNGYCFATNHRVYHITRTGIISSDYCGDIIRVRPGPNKEIWALTNNGIVVLNKNLHVKSRYLPGKIISDLVFDHSGGVWVTSIGHGVFHCRDLNELVYCYPDICHKEILMIKNNQSGLYLSLADGGCYEMTGTSMIKIHQFKKTVACMGIYDSPDYIYFATKKGIFLKHKPTGKISEILNSQGLSIYSVGLEFPAPDTCVSFCGTGIATLIGKQYKYETLLKNKIYSYLYYDHENFLIGTKKGLLIYNWRKNTGKQYNTFFSNKFISSLTTDPHQNIWVITRGEGIYMITPDQKILKVTSFPFSAVEEIVFTSPHTLIVSTNTGVYSNHYRNHKITSEWLNVIDFQVNDLDINGNKVWLASSDGLFSSDFKGLDRYHYFPVVVHSVFSGGKRINTHGSIQLPGGNDIRFNFDFLNYRWPVKSFYFTLHGPSPLKGIISGNVLQIQNLLPGTYTLTVYPMQGNLYYKEHYIQRPFTIVPAFWQTLWFRILSIACIILITTTIVAWYFTIKRKRERKKAEMIRTLAEYRLTALKAQINPHFISNSLSSIQSIIERGKIDQANQYIAKFSLFIRYVLKFTDKNVIRLNEELTILDLYIELERLRFSDYFDFHIEIDPEVQVNHIYIPPLITQPFVENAIWHGLLSLKDIRQPKLTILVHYRNNNLVISVQDNGVGRKKPAIIHTPIHESKGISLIKNRLDHLNKMYGIKDTRMEIVDLYNEGAPAGTRVDIILPKELLHYLENRMYESAIS